MSSVTNSSISFLCIALASSVAAQSTESSGTFPLEAVSQHPKPEFLFNGKRLSDPILNNPLNDLSAYEEATNTYDEIIDCLDQKAVGIDTVNIDLFAWSEFRSVEDVMVCLFYVADFLQDPDELIAWFERQGGHRVIEYNVPAAVFRRLGGASDGIGIGTSWSVEQLPPDSPLDRLSVHARSYGADVRMSFDGQPKSTYFSFSYK